MRLDGDLPCNIWPSAVILRARFSLGASKVRAVLPSPSHKSPQFDERLRGRLDQPSALQLADTIVRNPDCGNNSFNDRIAKFRHATARASARLSLLLVLSECMGLSACGLGTEQRSAVIAFGHSLDEHGQLVEEESTYIRSEVKAMRVLAMSLPNPQSASLFNDVRYENLDQGVPEPKIERLVQIGGRASNFGSSIAEVADITSSTAAETKLSAATRQLALTAGAISEAASGVAIGVPAVNFVTFVSLEAYRTRYLRRALPDAEPAFRAAQRDVDAAFDPGKPDSLLAVFSAATDQLAATLESQGAADTVLSAGDRELVANSYRVVARNRDHIKYVTSHELKLMDKAAVAYDAVIAELEGNDGQLDAVESYSSTVFQVRLAFQSLK